MDDIVWISQEAEVQYRFALRSKTKIYKQLELLVWLLKGVLERLSLLVGLRPAVRVSGMYRKRLNVSVG